MNEQVDIKLTEEQITEIKRVGAEDPVWWIQHYLPEWFPDRVPWFHKGMIAILTGRVGFLDDMSIEEQDLLIEYFVWEEDPEDPETLIHSCFARDGEGRMCLQATTKTSIMIPRGFAKTTLCNGIVLWMIYHEIIQFLVYLSESATHAKSQLGNIRKQITGNALLNAVYGNLRPMERVGNPWNNEHICTTTGIDVVAIGRGGQVRGKNEDSKRPDLIICDDVEDKESVKTAEQRKKVVEWFNGDVLPALPRRGGGRVIVLGTRLATQCLLETIRSDPRFISIRLAATLKDGSLLWPEHMGEQELAIEKKAAIRTGTLHIFYLEYYGQVRGDANANFRPEFFIIGGIAPQDFIYRSLCIDPAISGKPDADYCALGVAGMSQQGQVAVLDVYGEKGMTPRDQVNKFFEMYIKWRPRYNGVESIAYQAALIHLLREEMFRRQLFFEITPITHGNTAKEERIRGALQPRYANGNVTHLRHFPMYEEQLLDFPLGKKDLPDVMAMAVNGLKVAAPMAAGDRVDLAADQYEPLPNLSYEELPLYNVGGIFI